MGVIITKTGEIKETDKKKSLKDLLKHETSQENIDNYYVFEEIAKNEEKKINNIISSFVQFYN